MLGVLSLIAWSLFIVVTLKYVIVIMRADNRGEGGILALTALALRAANRGTRRAAWIITAGMIGAALFYGDGVITPAISVLSAVEGIKVATPVVRTLYPADHRGAAARAVHVPAPRHWQGRRVFRPDHGAVVRRARAAWAGPRSRGIPAILFALNPVHGIRFLLADPGPRLPAARRRGSRR